MTSPGFWHFPAPLPVEDNLHGEVIAKILDVMLSSGGDEHQITRLKRIAPAVVHQYTVAAANDIQPILLVGRWAVWRNRLMRAFGIAASASARFITRLRSRLLIPLSMERSLL